MIERCPGCGARGPGDDVCRRCGAELLWLARVDAASQRSLRETVSLLTQNNLDRAMHQAMHTLSLRKTNLASVLAGFAAWKLR